MHDRKLLSRLTEREKVCLRQWLQHKSAKEIAADLGISHHAVEKRLKMARTSWARRHPWKPLGCSVGLKGTAKQYPKRRSWLLMLYRGTQASLV